MHITLCILTRNELPSLKIVFPQIPAPSKSAGYDRMVAIDGGSTDGTLEFFAEQGVETLAQSRRGRGDAFQLALKNLTTDACIFFSPDGNEDIADLPRFRPLLEDGAHLVIASRMMPGAHNEEDDNFFRPRKWANNGFNLAANVLFGRKTAYVTDSINGYRAVRREVALGLGLDALDYTIEYQMTIRALQQRLRIVEFPTHEGARVAGQTQARSIPTGLRFLRALWREFRLSIRGIGG